jgi:hypothetical protein
VEKCGFYLPQVARYDYLLNLPEKEDIAKAIKAAMEEIELYKPELAGCLPKDEYFGFNRRPEQKIMLKQLLKNFEDIPKDETVISSARSTSTSSGSSPSPKARAAASSSRPAPWSASWWRSSSPSTE